MKNLSLRRMLLTFVATAALIFSTMAFSCGKKCEESCKDKVGEEKTVCIQVCREGQKATFLSWAKDINQAFISARQHIATLKPRLLPAWDRGTTTAGKLITAVENSNQVDALKLVAELIPVVEEAAAAFTGNITVLTILALANIGLHFFVNHYNPPRGARLGQEGRVLRDFKEQATWGCQYQPARCK